MLRERWLVRISVGLESPEDLVLDLQQALGAALDEDAAHRDAMRDELGQVLK
jgi:hypothetical protein